MTVLVLQLTYLTGRSVATTYNDREQAEWPPHPARIYSALVATWADSEERDPAERAALEWLETLGAPSIYASEASRRQVVAHFVPVNDTTVLSPLTRQRAKLDELRQAHDTAKADYDAAQRTGDKKGLDKATKALAQSEKAIGKERKKFDKQTLDDQQAFAAGKHPKAALEAAHALIPEHRGKQPRTFPSVSPDDPRVFMRWAADPAGLERHQSALISVASKVVRVGHSSSLVACSVVSDCPTPAWEPDDAGEEVFRLPAPGQFARLEEAFERHQEFEPRVLPCRFQRYGKGRRTSQEVLGGSCFGDEWVVFRQVSGRRLSQTSCVEVARAMRGALLKYAEDPPPELLSGHISSGQPSAQPHLAIVPLPFVGHQHATGELLGLALVFPKKADPEQRRAVQRAIGVWEQARRDELDDDLVDTPPLRLMLGNAGAVDVERIEWGAAPLKTLRPDTWCQVSHAWVTATPIALDRNPGDLFSRDKEKSAAAYAEAERSIATACERIGLPTPSYIQIHPSVPLNGAVKARTYPPFPSDPQKHQRVKVHARIEFPVRVAGPIALGAGRYYGLGLCMPQPREARLEA